MTQALGLNLTEKLNHFINPFICLKLLKKYFALCKQKVSCKSAAEFDLKMMKTNISLYLVYGIWSLEWEFQF